jgi:hypothetical protein
MNNSRGKDLPSVEAPKKQEVRLQHLILSEKLIEVCALQNYTITIKNNNYSDLNRSLGIKVHKFLKLTITFM